MINNTKKNNSRGFSYYYNRVIFFFKESENFWRGFGIFAVILAFELFFYYIVSIYVYGGSLFGKEVEGPKIRSIKVRTGSTIKKEQLLETLNLKPGMPFYDKGVKSFHGDLEEKVEKIMKNAPTISSLEITRQPSNSVVIVVTERIPIARFPNTHLAVDADGVIFVSKSNGKVPDFLGFPKSLVNPGNRLQAENKNQIAALELVKYINEVNGNVDGINFSVTSVDITSKYRLDCVFNGGIKVEIAWKGMGEGTPESTKNLASQLKVWAMTYSHPQSSGGSRFNLTIPNKCNVK